MALLNERMPLAFQITFHALASVVLVADLAASAEAEVLPPLAKTDLQSPVADENNITDYEYDYDTNFTSKEQNELYSYSLIKLKDNSKNPSFHYDTWQAHPHFRPTFEEPPKR